MAVSYFAEDVKMPAIKKERNDRLDTSCRFGVWEEMRRYSLYLLFR